MNILLGVLMVISVALLVYAIATGGSEAAISVKPHMVLPPHRSRRRCRSLLRRLRNGPEPGRHQGALLSFVLIVVIVGIAYFISASHSVQIPDLANNGVFDHGATVLTETSILVTYVAIVAAIVTVVVTEIWGALK